MAINWEEVPLKKIAKPISRTVQVEAGTEYRTIGVKWWGKGAYERETIDGSRTSAKTLSIVREGDLIINKIWVRHGSVAIAGKDVDGCAGSGEFPTFELDINRVDPRWIHWQTQMKSFWVKCDALSQGTSGKNRIKPELFLTIKTPLPSLEEQRRIISKIEVLAKPICEASEIRKSTENIFDTFISSYLNKSLSPQKFSTIQMGDVVNLVKRKADVTDMETIKSLGVKWWGKGAYLAEEKSASELRADRFEVRANDVIYNDMWARHGSVAIVADELDGHLASAHFPTWELDQSKIYPPFFAWCFRSPWFWKVCGDNAQGSTGRNAISKPSFRSIIMPVPPVEEQRRIVAYLDGLQAKVNALRELQAESARELSALMPSVLDRAFKGEL